MMQPIDRNDTFHSALTEPIAGWPQPPAQSATPPLYLPAYDTHSMDDDIQVMEFQPRRGRVVPRVRHKPVRGILVLMLVLALLIGAFWAGAQSVQFVSSLVKQAGQMVCMVSSATDSAPFAFCATEKSSPDPMAQPIAPQQPAQSYPYPQMPIFPRPHFMQPQPPVMNPVLPPCPPPPFERDFPQFNCQPWP